MDCIVQQAIRKWPNVPDCFGWLGLDARGHWYMRDNEAQAAGSFASGVPAAKGVRLQHEKMIAFVHRNYQADELGRWAFQNGPQRVYVELELTPLIWRIQEDFSIEAHTGLRGSVLTSVLDEHGRLYLNTADGFGLVHTQDVVLAAEAIQNGLWPVEQMEASQLPSVFRYVQSPAQAT